MGMLSNYFTSLTRTYVPIAVGALLTWLGTHFHVVLSGSTSDALVIAVTGVLGAAYYSLARLVEERFPQLGWLLGKPARPNYGELGDQAQAVVDDVLGDFTGPDPLEVEGADPNTPGASTPGVPA